MIIVKGPMKLSEGGGTRMQSAMTTMIAATRAQAGCLHYSLTPDADDPDLIHVHEEWADQASLGANLVGDHVIEFQFAMRRTRIIKADVNIHNPDGSVKRLINV